MVRRFFALLSAAVALATLALAVPVSGAGQGQGATAKKPATAGGGGAAAAKASKNWAPPRTPWGDPDISGNLTNVNEANTPFERPDEFAGKRVEDITKEQLAELNRARQKNALETAPFITGSRADGIAIGVPIHWLDHLEAENSRAWFVTDPPDGKIPPLTQEAIDRNAALAKAREGRSVADSYTDRSLGDRCVARRGVPVNAMQPGIYGNSYHVVQTKDYIAIRYEMDGSRVIPIEGRGGSRPHLSQKMRSYFGDAVARWDGDTLVVDTTNFNDIVQYRGARSGLRTIERFRRTAPKTVEWTVTVEDPRTWARPWSYLIPLTEDDGQPIFEYACHEGNYGIRNILAGAREDQKRGIEPSNGPALPPGAQEE